MDKQEMKQMKEEEGALITEKRVLLFINCLLLGIGIAGGPLVMRLYYLHGGKRVWLQACLQTAGFPIMIFPLTLSFLARRRRNAASISPSPPFLMTPPLLAFAASNGLLTGAADYVYARGVGMIPVSTSSLILSTQLAFTAVFCYFLVRQKFTAFSVNAVVLLTMAAVVLALNPKSDMSKEPRSEYFAGFFITLAAAAAFALVLPLVELGYSKAEVEVTYDLVMEVQFVFSFCATAVCLVGMAVDKDFHAIKREAKLYDLGEATYYLVMVFDAIVWQFFYLGTLGVIHFGSSLLSGVIIAVSLPITEMLAILFYNEKFQPQKGVSLALSIWGFISYFYGEIQTIKANRRNQIANAIA